MYPIITIDGQSGSGKGTLAYRLATHFGFRLLDSGALYRLVGLVAYQQGLLTPQIITTRQYPSEFEKDIGQLTQALTIDFVVNPHTQAVEVTANGQVLQDIRSETVGGYASLISGFASVRQALLGLQRQMAEQSGVVADGRDMGTVVFPQACAKLYLIASAHERAARRVAQLQKMGQTVAFEEVLAEIQRRDHQDEQRSLAPSRPASDALIIDTTLYDADEVYHRALAFVNEKLKTQNN